jgi:hypothetical protein
MGIHEQAGGIGHDNDTGSHLCRARHSAIRWPWGLSQIRSLAKGEKSKRSGSRPQWRRWLSSMSFPSVSTAPARDRDGRAVVVARASGSASRIGRGSWFGVQSAADRRRAKGGTHKRLGFLRELVPGMIWFADRANVTKVPTSNTTTTAPRTARRLRGSRS